MDKVDYVLSQKQTRPHTCHWPDCNQQVPPAMFMCRRHWFSLPSHFRGRIWQHFRPGQEEDMKPSPEYLDVVREVIDWCLKNPDTKPGKRTW